MTRFDKYTEQNVSALVVLEMSGNNPFSGIHKRTIEALSRRGLVHDLGDGRAIVTDKGTAAVDWFWEKHE